MDFKTTVKNNEVEVTTKNGMAALASSCDALVDLFFKVGAARGQDITKLFEEAFQEHPEIATKIMLWARDVRGGAGERQLFRDILLYMENNHPSMLIRVIPHIPTFGRWDDMLVFATRTMKNFAYTTIREALVKNDGLCAKWIPRKGQVAVELRNFMGLSPKQYRKLLVNATKVVETQMCAKQWDQINYSHVPSIAASIYKHAFDRNDTARYKEYRDGLISGETKINAAAIYPHDIVKSLAAGIADVSVAQWEALPNYMSDVNVLPMVDVSGSMNTPVGRSKNLLCINVAIALGLYCADKNRGSFKDMFLTFSDNTKIEVLKGNLLQKYNQMSHAEWGLSTNIMGAFDAILKVAKNNNVPEVDMPKILLILSDMQFNQCTTKAEDTAYKAIGKKYADAGYDLPKIVFWNLKAHDNVPVKFDQSGTALVSGFSPSIMKSILGAKEFTPLSIMLDTVNVERYDVL